MNNYTPIIQPNKINHIFYLSAIARKKENRNIPIICTHGKSIIKPINIISIADYINSNGYKYDIELLKLEIKKEGVEKWENNKIIWRLYISIDENKLDNNINWEAFFSNRFIMELTRPQNKKTLNYLIDIDTKDESLINFIKYSLNAMNIKILYQSPTPNGYHIVTPPNQKINFLIRNYRDIIHIISNAILFLEYIHP